LNFKDIKSGHFWESNNEEIQMDQAPVWFWLSWTTSTFSVGRGPEPGFSVILQWTASVERRLIRAVGFAGLDDSTIIEFEKLSSKLKYLLLLWL
jgi:hypothetical protein